MTLAHLVYIPLILAFGIYIGRQIEQHSAERRRKKRKKLEEIREKRQSQSTVD